MTRTATWVLSGLFFASSVAAGGCARREHIRADHGEPTQNWFGAQAQATQQEQGDGLDSEEAALIHQSYRNVLSREGSGRAQDTSQVLILEEPANARGRRR